MPIASGAIAAAIDAPAPPLDPPAVTFTFQGFLVVPNILFDVLISWANSGVFVLPNNIPPAAFNLSTEIVSSSGTSFSNNNEPNVVLIPLVCKISFIKKGTPSRGRGLPPEANRSSMARASSNIVSLKVQIAFITGFTSSILLINADATSEALSFLLPTPSAIFSADISSICSDILSPTHLMFTRII